MNQRNQSKRDSDTDREKEEFREIVVWWPTIDGLEYGHENPEQVYKAERAYESDREPAPSRRVVGCPFVQIVRRQMRHHRNR